MVLTEEHKEKISKANKNHPDRVGRKLSDEHKEAIRKAHVGKSLSEETKQKISEKFRGENHPKAKLTQEKANEIKIIFSNIKPFILH